VTAREQLDEYADGLGEELLTADGFDQAIVGVARQFNKLFVVYDTDKVLDILERRDGLSADDAAEFFEVNIVGAWVGDGTPAFLTRFETRRRK
jgi:hypothetical protein